MSDLVSLFMLLAGGGGLVHACALHLRAWRSRCWPSVAGEIVVSRALNGAGHDPGAVGGGTRADIQYRYTVGDRRLQGKRICAGEVAHLGSDARAARFLRRYPAGARVAVFYNPDNPAESCLERRSQAGGFHICLGITLLLASRLV